MRGGDTGSILHFPWSHHTTDRKTGTLVATLPSTWFNPRDSYQVISGASASQAQVIISVGVEKQVHPQNKF